MYHQAVKNLKQILMEHWSMIHNQPLLKKFLQNLPWALQKPHGLYLEWKLNWNKVSLNCLEYLSFKANKMLG